MIDPKIQLFFLVHSIIAHTELTTHKVQVKAKKEPVKLLEVAKSHTTLSLSLVVFQQQKRHTQFRIHTG